MGKLFLAIWFFLGSLVGAHHQSPALQTTLSIVSPTVASLTPAPTVVCSASACPSPSLTHTPSLVDFSTYHFPPPNTQPLDTSNWVYYFDPDTRVKFNYPNGWEYRQPSAGHAVVTFKPVQARLEDMGGKEYCVEAALLVNDYQSELQRIPIPYDGKFEVKPITIANLPGIHFRAADYGEYMLNKNGKALQFNYLIINGKDHGQEAEQMAESLVFVGK